MGDTIAVILPRWEDDQASGTEAHPNETRRDNEIRDDMEVVWEGARNLHSHRSWFSMDSLRLKWTRWTGMGLSAMCVCSGFTDHRTAFLLV